MPLHFSDGGSLHSWRPSGKGEVVAGQISPARQLADVNGSTPTLPCRSAFLACSQIARHLPRAPESPTVGNAATWHIVWSDCMSHFTWFSFNSTNFNWKGPTNPHIRHSHYECKTGRSDIFKDPLWNAGMKSPEASYWNDWSPPAPASACQRRMGWDRLWAQQRRPELSTRTAKLTAVLFCTKYPGKINAWAALLPSVEFLQQTVYI